MPSVLVALVTSLLLAGSAGAQSSLRLDRVHAFGETSGRVYDDAGTAIGRSVSRVVRTDEGNVRLVSETTLTAGGGARLEALLSPQGERLVLLEEQTRTFETNGNPIVEARIDHRLGNAICELAGEDPVEVTLPQGERIANVVMPFVLLPLARGDVDEARFQFLMCGGTPRIFDAVSTVTRRFEAGKVEMTTEFDIGPVLTLLAGAFVPKPVMWLDPGAEDTPWLGHYAPLRAGEESVAVIREGVSPGPLLGLASY